MTTSSSVVPPTPNHTIQASHPPISYRGRWKCSPTQGSIATYAGVSLSLCFTSQFLYLQFGPLTKRVCENGGNPMLSWTVCDAESEPGGKVYTADGTPGEYLRLFPDADGGDGDGTRKRRLELYVADWASVVDLESFIVDSETSIHPLPPTSSIPRILFIGDSISCSFSTSEPKTLGAYEAYPAISKRLLSQNHQKQITTDVAAVVGITLCDATLPDDENVVIATGMNVKFWQEAPWLGNLWDFSGPQSIDHTLPKVVVIALGSNDHNAGVGRPPGKFVRTLQKFITQLSDRFKGTLEHIIVFSPFIILYDIAYTPTYFEPELQTFIESLRDSPGPKVHHLPTSGWLAVQDTMDGLHPTVGGNHVIAQRLTEWMLKNGIV